MTTGLTTPSPYYLNLITEFAPRPITNEVILIVPETAPNQSIERQAFRQLPIEERRRILTQQAEAMKEYYQEDQQWKDWLNFENGEIYDYQSSTGRNIRANTARLKMVEVPETRFLEETGFLIFAYPSSIDIRAISFYTLCIELKFKRESYCPLKRTQNPSSSSRLKPTSALSLGIYS